MTTGYSKEYLDEYDIIDESFFYPKDSEAKQKRDRRARELRKQGYTVQIETVSFEALGYGITYKVLAEKKKQ